jgi:dTDP-4-amino-4,6-dideoxygalactose transaminase
MVTGNDEGLLARVRRLRDHGRTTKYEHDEIGSSDRLDAIQAAILNVKLPHLNAWTKGRRNHARRYIELLGGCNAGVPYEAPAARHIYHLFVIRTTRRDTLLTHLNARGIGAGIHYPVPVHKQPVFVRQGYGGAHLPHTEAAAAEVLSLPMYPELTADDVFTVSEAVKELSR